MLTLSELLANPHAKLAALIAAIPHPGNSPVVNKMLTDARLVPEQDPGAFRNVDLATQQSQRSRGRMPPHHRWGSHLVFESADVVGLIRGKLVEIKPATAKDLRK